jgi:A118 family predicted phage portal protein
MANWIDDKYNKYHDKMQEYAAWYSGSSEELLDYYLGVKSYEMKTVNDYNLEKKGMFWEKDIHNDRATMLHVPIAGDIASTSADFLFSEMPDVKIPEAHEETAESGAADAQDRLDTIIEEGDVYSRLLEGAETSSAIGGVFVKLDWDADVKEFPIPIMVQPDNAMWNFKWGFLQEVKFFKVVDHPDTNLYYRLVETRRKGIIFNELYKGTTNKLGKKVSLESHESTAGMEEVIEHGLDSILAWYVPNKRPNRLWRGSALGESDLQGIVGLMDAIDETYTNWVRDLRIARGRIIVPEYMLESDSDGNLYHDIDKEVFVKVGGIADAAEQGDVTAVQFDIRAQQHYDTAMELMKQTYSGAGYSPASFGLGDSTSNATATEIKQQQSKSFKTSAKKAKYWTSTLEDMFYWMLQVDNYVFGSNNGDYKVQVNIQDSVQTDPMQQADAINKLTQAKAMSIDTVVRKLNPQWNEKQVENEVNRIMNENGMAVNEPDDLV